MRKHTRKKIRRRQRKGTRRQRKGTRRQRKGTRRQRGGWFGSNWFGTWGKKTKKGIFGSWSSSGMKCNPYLPGQCPGGGRCVKSGLALGPFSFGGKCVNW
jgi:hypothetical protein